MGWVGRLDRFQRRHPRVGLPIAVVYKYGDDQGGYLAALITYYAFVSFFPLLLLLSTILSFSLDGNPALQQRVLHSALGQFPVVGPQLQDPRHLGGGAGGLVVGILGALYGGLGVAQAAQNAMDVAWMVPRNSRPNPLTSRGRGLLLLCTAGLAVIGTTLLAALGGGAGAYSVGLRILAVAGALALNAAILVLVFVIATARPLAVRQVLPGALAAAVIWQLLQSFGATYVSHVVKNASATNSVFALVLGLIAFIYVAAVALVVCVEINVVRTEKLYPRALLTPFTDAVELTEGDRSSYRGQAKAQRAKGFEEIQVGFGEQDPG